MFVNVIPPGLLEILLFVAIVGTIMFVVRRVGRRRSFLSSLGTFEDLPLLRTAFRTEVRIRRLFRDREQNVVLVDGSMGDRPITFCAGDFVSNAAIYEAAQKTPVTIALFGLATLERVAAGDRSQVVALQTDEPASFAIDPSGPRPNDYGIAGRIASHRVSRLDGDPVNVYTFEGAHDLGLEFATEPVSGVAPFADGDSVYGTTRLYGYWPAANEAGEVPTPLPPTEASQQ